MIVTENTFLLKMEQKERKIRRKKAWRRGVPIMTDASSL